MFTDGAGGLAAPALRRSAQTVCAKLAGLRNARGGLPINAGPPEAIAGCGSDGHASGLAQCPPSSPFRCPGAAPAGLVPLSFPFVPLFADGYAGVRIFGPLDRPAFSGPGWLTSVSVVISSLVLPSSRTSRAASRLSNRARSSNGPSEILTRFATPFCPSFRPISQRVLFGSARLRGCIIIRGSDAAMRLPRPSVKAGTSNREQRR
jgi:hypothetical protein